VINAMAHSVTVVGAGWSRSQEWMSCARVLWDRLHTARPNAAAQRNDGVAGSERTILQVNGLPSDVEQPVRVVRCGRLYMA